MTAEHEESVDKADAPQTEEHLSEISTLLFKEEMAARNYHEALHILLMNPKKTRRSACLRQLLIHLLESGERQTIVDLSYGPLESTVADILETRCRSESIDPHQNQHFLYELTYAYYIARFEFAKAASILFQLAMRLKRELIQSREVLEQRCRLLAMVHQALQVPTTSTGGNSEAIVSYEAESESAIRSEEETNVGGEEGRRLESLIVAMSKEDVGRELLKSEARLELAHVDADAKPPPLECDEIVTRLLRIGHYETAWQLTLEFELQPYDLLRSATQTAILDAGDLDSDDQQQQRSERLEEAIESDPSSPWHQLSCYVDLALRHWPNDARLLRTVTYCFLERSLKLPIWLETRYKDMHLGDLLRTYLDFGDLDAAFALILPEIGRAITRVNRSGATASVAVAIEENSLLLPFTHIDELIHLAKSTTSADGEKREHYATLAEETRCEVLRFLKCCEVVQQAQRFIR